MKAGVLRKFVSWNEWSDVETAKTLSKGILFTLASRPLRDECPYVAGMALISR